MDQHRHRSKVAVVTGAGSGIGRATALRLLREGATVIAIDVNDGQRDGLKAAAVPAAERLTWLHVDVSDQASVDAAMHGIDRVDILVNNAGVMDHFLPLGELDDHTWDQVLGVNLNGPMRMSRAVLPQMEAHGSGTIVMVGSKSSFSGGSSGVAYTASKHGLIGLVRHLAYFYGPKGIRCNAVCPGAVMTGIAASAAPASEWAMRRAQVSMATMGSVAEPDQIAAAISWIASDEAVNINGAVLVDDGGWGIA